MENLLTEAIAGQLRETAFRDPASYFRQYAALSHDEAVDQATRIWDSINEPNLESNTRGGLGEPAIRIGHFVGGEISAIQRRIAAAREPHNRPRGPAARGGRSSGVRGPVGYGGRQGGSR